MKPFFYKIFGNIKTVFSGRNLLWHLLAIGLTYVVVVSDFDWKYYLAFHKYAPLALLWPAIVTGMLLPVVLPFILLLIGRLIKSKNILFTAYTVGQAALLGYLTSIFYKSFTGRIPPEFGGRMATDISKQFEFGFLRHGVFWGWPSSHTTVAFAMSVALINLFPKNPTVKILSLIYCIYIGLAISGSIHWFSEFIAGAIFGSLVGYVVGKNFYGQRFES